MAAIVREVKQPIDLLALSRTHITRYPYLLKSVAHGRYDILFACPGESLVLQPDGVLQQADGTTVRAGDFLDGLDTAEVEAQIPLSQFAAKSRPT